MAANIIAAPLIFMTLDLVRPGFIVDLRLNSP
eukprot:COSAG02_NODE_182_length_30594_cov_23.562912_3_plen_32_part_00